MLFRSVKGSNGVRYDVGGYAYFKAVIDSLRHSAESITEACLVLDAGDNFQGTAVSGMTRGASQIKLLNILHPDAVTLGNHEFDYGWQNIDSLMRFKTMFDVVNANITFNDGREFSPPYLIKQIGSLRIAIIGLITDNLVNLTLPQKMIGLKVNTCAKTLRKFLPEIRKAKPDLIIVLSHIGVEADVELAMEFPEVDLFVGGHSHTPLFEPRKVGRSIIVQAGSRGQFVGDLELDIDSKGDSVISYSGRLIETKNVGITADPAITEQVQLIEAPVEARLGETIGILEKDWTVPHGESSNLASFEATVFREELGAAIGVINFGGLRKTLLAGPITMRDIYEINPFGNDMVTFAVTGAEIKPILEWVTGGKGNEACEFSGITCKFNKSKKYGNRISAILVGGKKLDLKKHYSVATNNFIASHLHGMFGIEEAMHPINPAGIYDFDLIVAAVRKRKVISGEYSIWMNKE